MCSKFMHHQSSMVDLKDLLGHSYRHVLVYFRHWIKAVKERKAYNSICDGVAVHPHLGVDVDQVPAESFALQSLPQCFSL